MPHDLKASPIAQGRRQAQLTVKPKARAQPDDGGSHQQVVSEAIAWVAGSPGPTVWVAGVQM